jgi:hypothetical protein
MARSFAALDLYLRCRALVVLCDKGAIQQGTASDRTPSLAARVQIERQGDLDGSVSGDDRTVIGQPLHWVQRADRAEALLDAANHHVDGHLAEMGSADPLRFEARQRKTQRDKLAVLVATTLHVRSATLVELAAGPSTSSGAARVRSVGPRPAPRIKPAD